MTAAPAHRLARRNAAFAARLRTCHEGVAAIEFGIVFPVFLILLLGCMDIGHTVYAKSVLSGAVAKAARESSLETSNTAIADAAVKKVFSVVVPNPTFASTRTEYNDFSDIGRPEAWNDQNGNGKCDNNEGYTDENSDGKWNKDVGQDGNGSANDVVLYTVTVTYAPVFKVPFMPKLWATRTLTASALKKNQPFASQGKYGSTAGSCA